jgi:hypothetical protein
MSVDLEMYRDDLADGSWRCDAHLAVLAAERVGAERDKKWRRLLLLERNYAKNLLHRDQESEMGALRRELLLP